MVSIMGSHILVLTTGCIVSSSPSITIIHYWSRYSRWTNHRLYTPSSSPSRPIIHNRFRYSRWIRRCHGPEGSYGKRLFSYRHPCWVAGEGGKTPCVMLCVMLWVMLCVVLCVVMCGAVWCDTDSLPLLSLPLLSIVTRAGWQVRSAVSTAVYRKVQKQWVYYNL